MKRVACSVVICLVLSGLVGVPAAVNAAQAPGVWVNSDDFVKTCPIGHADSYPQLMYNQANTGLANLGYTGGQHVIGHGFTRSAFLAAVGLEYAVYVHSHGDIYNSSSIKAAFLQDPPAGRCNDYTKDYISAAQVATRAAPPNSLVIMSTCYLGSMYQPHTGPAHPNLMPEAFGIPKNQGATNGTFYLGYVYETYDSSAYEFEHYFFWWLSMEQPGDSFADAWVYAQDMGPYEYPDASDPFLTAWYGDINDAGPLYPEG
jgi:hypothetical protein